MLFNMSVINYGVTLYGIYSFFEYWYSPLIVKLILGLIPVVCFVLGSVCISGYYNGVDDIEKYEEERKHSISSYNYTRLKDVNNKDLKPLKPDKN